LWHFTTLGDQDAAVTERRMVMFIKA